MKCLNFSTPPPLPDPSKPPARPLSANMTANPHLTHNPPEVKPSKPAGPRLANKRRIAAARRQMSSSDDGEETDTN